jgi:23S rRNA (adenine1618-N6)-methyltransferase
MGIVKQSESHRRTSLTGKKSGLHPRNRNNDYYNFPELIGLYPELGHFVFVNRHGNVSIDFADPHAVRTLNTILLRHHYGISFWEIPPDHLCPPIPGRADYLHHLADLLASSASGAIPRGSTISVLDIGVGANCIYPLIGNVEYGWRFVGSDTDPSAVASAQRILDGNGITPARIEIRTQQQPDRFFHGIIKHDEQFDLTLCNPPFHSTIGQATAGTARKWKNLGTKFSPSSLNFGGRQHELVYPGGEAAFVTAMARESESFARQVAWFTTLISKQSNLPSIRKELTQIQTTDVRTIEMTQGQKKSRFIAWTFLEPQEMEAWKSKRWSNGAVRK